MCSPCRYQYCMYFLYPLNSELSIPLLDKYCAHNLHSKGKGLVLVSTLPETLSKVRLTFTEYSIKIQIFTLIRWLLENLLYSFLNSLYNYIYNTIVSILHFIALFYRPQIKGRGKVPKSKQAKMSSPPPPCCST